MTIAAENLQCINNGINDWGNEPYRRSAMEHFVGLGFITCDGAIWHHSRKLLRPTFNKSNLLDFASLAAEVDSFLDKLPIDGSTVDLQPHFFLIVSIWLLEELVSNNVQYLNSSINFLLGLDARTESEDAPCSPGTFVDAFHDGIFGCALQIIFGPFAALIPKPKYWSGVATSHEFLDFYVQRALEQRKSATRQAQNQDIGNFKHSSLMEGLVAQTDDKLYIRYQILQGLMASQETTSNLLGNTLFLLSRDPVHWQKIRKEALEKGDRLLNFDDLLSSKILQNILQECKWNRHFAVPMLISLPT